MVGQSLTKTEVKKLKNLVKKLKQSHYYFLVKYSGICPYLSKKDKIKKDAEWTKDIRALDLLLQKIFGE